MDEGNNWTPNGTWNGSLDIDQASPWQTPWSALLTCGAILLATQGWALPDLPWWFIVLELLGMTVAALLFHRAYQRWRMARLVRRHGPDLTVRLAIDLPRVQVQVGGTCIDTTIPQLTVERTALDGWLVTDENTATQVDVRGDMFPIAERVSALRHLAMLAERRAGLRTDTLEPIEDPGDGRASAP